MTATTDVNHITSCLDGGLYILVDEFEPTKKKVWQKFYRVVSRDTGNIVIDTTSCRGYAACRKCREICRLGPKGGTTELEKHLVLCSQTSTVDDTALRLVEQKLKKENKNQTEKERKDEIKALINDSASLVMGQESGQIPLEELTKARLLRACLSEIPPAIVQFCTDGKSPKDRPKSFYEELEAQLNVLNQRFYEAQNEAYPQVQCETVPMQHAIYNVQNGTPVNLHLGLSYSSADENIIDITWVPTDVESTLAFDRISMIGRNLSELVHPEDYAEIVRDLSTKRSADNTVSDTKDFTFPDCRVTESIINRLKTAPVYKPVFLTGYIRQSIRTARVKCSHQDKSIMQFHASSNSYWPRLASFIHIRTHYQYMTLHSMDGTIIQADKRIKMVAGYTCEEVINRRAHDFIVEDAVSFVSEAQRYWLDHGHTNCISYPLKGKNQIVHVKSRGEFVYYREPKTNQIVLGFICNNTVIHKEDYQRERSSLQVQWNTSCDTSTLSVDELYHNLSSTQETGDIDIPMAMEQNSNTCLNEITQFQSSTLLSPDTSFSMSSDWSFLFP